MTANAYSSWRCIYDQVELYQRFVGNTETENGMGTETETEMGTETETGTEETGAGSE